MKVFYFSGTGNSLAVARDLALKLKAEMISIASIIYQEKINIGDNFGIVFPVYNQGIPYIIKRFVQKLDNIEKKYIFSICTYGNNPGISLKYLASEIKKIGGNLSCGFAVQMPYNYVTPSLTLKKFFKSFTLREIPIEKQENMFYNWKNKLEEIYEYINNENVGKIETKAKVIENIIDFLNLREVLQKRVWLKIGNFKGKTNLNFLESIQLYDHAFHCDDNCSSCAICKNVCPIQNIEIKNNKPIWLHHCEQCFACLQWCPKEAIQFGEKTKNKKRYHHPDVSLKDLIN